MQPRTPTIGVGILLFKEESELSPFFFILGRRQIAFDFYIAGFGFFFGIDMSETADSDLTFLKLS